MLSIYFVINKYCRLVFLWMDFLQLKVFYRKDIIWGDKKGEE